MTSVLDWAIRYAECGLRVFPVFGKRPITPNGFLQSTTDLDVINAWWKGNKNAQVAITIPDWAVIVDCDSGDAAQALSALDMDLPSTLTSKGKRGQHFWYALPEKSKVNRRIEVIPKVDILVNGYVVAPPSRHVSGVNYEWVTEFSVDAISEAPRWLLTLDQQVTKERDRVDADTLLEGVPQGQRQTALFRYACSLRADPKRTLKEAKILVRAVADASGSSDYDTDSLVERVWKRYIANEESKEPIKIWTLDGLEKANLPPPSYIVDRLLPAGVTLLYSAPKIGKSALIARIATEIVNGDKVLGRYASQRTGVLYLDLEQEESFSLQRWQMILGDKQMPSNLSTAFEWERIDSGGLELIGSFLSEHPEYGVVIVDTLADIWSEEESSDNAYMRDNRVMGKLQKLARDYGIALVVVHHTRKHTDNDYVDSASGSKGITGKAQAIWYLTRDRGDASGKLQVTGKNIPESTIFISFNEKTLRWEPT